MSLTSFIDVSLAIAIAALTCLLNISGIAIFIWMGIIGFVDTSGVAVAVIFVILSALQAVVTATWWKMSKKHNRQQAEEKQEKYAGNEMHEITAMLPNSASNTASV